MEFNSIGREVSEGANPKTVVDTGNVMLFTAVATIQYDVLFSYSYVDIHDAASVPIPLTHIFILLSFMA